MSRPSLVVAMAGAAVTATCLVMAAGVGAGLADPSVATTVTIDRQGPRFHGVVRSDDERCVRRRRVALMRRPRRGGEAQVVRTARTDRGGRWAITNFPRTSVLDRFNRPDGPVGDGWRRTYGPRFRIADGELRGTGEWSAMHWSRSLRAPHEAYVTLARKPAADDDYMYVALLGRRNLDRANGYAIEFDDDYWDLFRIDRGRFVRLGAWDPPVHDPGFVRNGDEIGLGLDGRDVVAYRRHGRVWHELGRVTDAAHRPRRMYRAVEFSDQRYVRLDNFGGGPPVARGLPPGVYFARVSERELGSPIPTVCAAARSREIVVR